MSSNAKSLEDYNSDVYRSLWGPIVQWLNSIAVQMDKCVQRAKMCIDSLFQMLMKTDVWWGE